MHGRHGMMNAAAMPNAHACVKFFVSLLFCELLFSAQGLSKSQNTHK